MRAVGIDIGGSGIKGAPVDLTTGEFAQERHRIPTPQPSTPQAVAEVIAELVGEYDLPQDVPIGVVYAIWSGVGVALVTVAGRLIWGDRLPIAAIGGIALIVAGVVAIQASGAGGG